MAEHCRSSDRNDFGFQRLVRKCSELKICRCQPARASLMLPGQQERRPPGRNDPKTGRRPQKRGRNWGGRRSRMAKVLDIVVVGGGINGAGIARDAAGRGLSVLLCEKSDLASGTS